MGCLGQKTVEDKNQKKEQNFNRNEELIRREEEEKRKKEEEEKKLKEEEEKKKQEEQEKEKEKNKEEVQKKGPLLILPEDNIELVTFTEKTMNLKKMQLLELEEHNYLRKLHGSPPLILNEELNQIAQKYAIKLAKEKVMRHSKEEDRYLKGKKGEWVGENLHFASASRGLQYASGDMSKAWYSEIKDYNFETGKSTGVTGHFTQLIWKDSKEVGFGVAFNGSILMSVANYYPGGNFNMSQCYKEQIPKLISKEEKTSKELFNLESVKKNEIDAINYIRKYHQVSNLELDEQLCEKAAKHAENMGKTGSFSSYYDNGEWKNWTNWGILYLLRGANYKGGEGVRKWYKKLEEYDFNLKRAKNKNDEFYINMGVALIYKTFKKVGFGYFIKDDNSLITVALFDGLVYSPHEGEVFPAA